MKNQRKSPAAVKAIAFLLLLGSLACFLLPWMKLAVDTGPDRLRMTPGEVLQNFLGVDARAAGDLVREELAAEGVQLQEPVLTDLLDKLLEGSFRLYQFPTLCRETGELLNAFRQPEAGGLLTTGSLVLWGIIGLLALLGLIALICQLSDRRGGILPYFLLGSLLCAGLLALRSEGNRILAEESAALLTQYGIDGLVSYLNIDTEIIKMGLGAYLCPFLALLAMLLMGIRKKTPKKSCRPTSYPARRAAGAGNSAQRSGAAPARQSPDWTCPVCGCRMEAGKRFCIRCGAERPRRPAAGSCPVCGGRLPDGATFCPGCGRPVALPDRSPRNAGS